MLKHKKYHIKNYVNTSAKRKEKLIRNICYFEDEYAKDRGSGMIVLSNVCCGFRVVLTNVKLLH